MSDVRSKTGAAIAGDFDSATGTPIVIDQATGDAYVLKDDNTIVKTGAETLALSSGSSLIGYLPAGTGAVATTVQAELRTVPRDAVLNFAVDNTGATNCTTALLAFYNASIADGHPGHIPAGTYKVTPGVLKFNNNNTAKAWPDITTDGYYATIFNVDTTTNENAPILEWTSVSSNGDQGTSWPGNSYWYGGSHGGLSFTDNSGQTATLRNAINLTACWAIKFGYMRGTTLRGSTVCCPANTINTTNPDPFATSYTTFEGIEGSSNKGWVCNNLNGVGCDSWVVEKVRGILCESGVWFGIGQGCKLNNFSCGSCAGWAFDDGSQAGSTANNRLTILVAEFDDVEYGIRLNKSSEVDIKQIRFNIAISLEH